MDRISFTINGENYTLSGNDVASETTLIDYIRNSLNLHGTKAMCEEGGCGACTVSVSTTHPVTKEKKLFSVNACLVHILSCHQWDITTVEGIGNRNDGYHAIQDRLAAFNGTQCGYCTPGWIMNMYSLYETTKDLTLNHVENSFAGNMCRCTGYRPILDAFKSFANDTDPEIKERVQDLEDLNKLKCITRCKNKRKCSLVDDEWCVIDDKNTNILEIRTRNGKWYKAYTIQDVFSVLSSENTTDYRLVAGNTGKGVYPINIEPKVLIDISSIASIKEHYLDVNLVLGAGMTLAEVMVVFDSMKENTNFKYLEQLCRHLDSVAHIQVRNVGTIGGNLALKNAHPDFASDVFLLFATVEATVTIVNKDLSEAQVNMEDFLTTDLKNKLIKNVKLPPLMVDKYFPRTFKIMPRAQNAHAIVNAGFLFKLDEEKKVLSSTITFGSITPRFVRASRTADLLRGLPLFDEVTLQRALAKLDEELEPNVNPPEPSPACRKSLALGLFYKAILSLCPNTNTRYKSGGEVLSREISRGVQMFETDKTLWPLNKPMPKLEAMAQCSGEAKYVCDTTSGPRDLHLAFVLSNICTGEILGFDASEALTIPGVVAFFKASDIPGKNSFTSKDVPMIAEEEEIFASKKVLYYGQPVGMIAAVNHKLAVKAAEKVKVNYKKDEKAPVLSIQDALNAPDKDKRFREDASVTATDRGTETTRVITGQFNMGAQYHYTMETQSCSVTNTEDGVSVRSATQWADLVHVAVAQSLNLKENQVEVSVGRVGGAYGGKASRAAQCACACALAARRLQRTCSLVMPLTHNMAAVGKRQDCLANYEIGVDNSGKIQYLNITYYSDCGCSFNDTSSYEIVGTMTKLYESSRWNIKGYSVLTDKPCNTWCRAPGTAEGVALVEHIMERIAYETKFDATTIRIQHIATEHDTIEDMITTFQMDCSYQDRKAQIQQFNAQNAWRKRSLKLSVMSYPISYFGNFPVTISVYHADGTVAISHGGIEMGQGINTKVAQVCAYRLKVPLDKVTVRGTNTFISPNAMCSNGSFTSELVAYATLKACDQLLERLQAVKIEDEDPWEELVKKAFNKGILLQATAMTSALDNLSSYSVHGVGAVEIELDVLTGAFVVRRVDLLEDTGVSISPDIDVGQIEGAFVMGLGLWTSEQLVYDQATGRLLTDRTWTYKPPGVKDIPVDFRVSFTRNSINPTGVLRSKATGEPALALSIVVTFALHEAIVEARKEFGYEDTQWLQLDNPCTVENIIKALNPKINSYKLF